MKIEHKTIGGNAPVFIIAEAGVNHNGRVELAFELAEKAAEAGADAVKFQHFYPEHLVVSDTPQADYQKVQAPGYEGQQQMLQALAIPLETHGKIRACCEELGIIYICTPYDSRALQDLADIKVAAIKVASTDTTNLPFLRQLDRLALPTILSTGMCTLDEVKKAVDELPGLQKADRLALLQCTAEYPAPIRDANLRAIRLLADTFGLPTGFSDHTPGIGASPWGVAAGACIIEKHFTLSRSLPGPDHTSSLEPDELRALVASIREVEEALGDGEKRVMESEARNKPLMQKRIVATCALAEGAILGEEHLTAKRAGRGIPVSKWDEVVGSKLARAVAAETPLESDHLAAR